MEHYDERQIAGRAAAVVEEFPVGQNSDLQKPAIVNFMKLIKQIVPDNAAIKKLNQLAKMIIKCGENEEEQEAAKISEASTTPTCSNCIIIIIIIITSLR